MGRLLCFDLRFLICKIGKQWSGLADHCENEKSYGVLETSIAYINIYAITWLLLLYGLVIIKSQLFFSFLYAQDLFKIMKTLNPLLLEASVGISELRASLWKTNFLYYTGWLWIPFWWVNQDSGLTHKAWIISIWWKWTFFLKKKPCIFKRVEKINTQSSELNLSSRLSRLPIKSFPHSELYKS